MRELKRKWRTESTKHVLERALRESERTQRALRGCVRESESVSESNDARYSLAREWELELELLDELRRYELPLSVWVSKYGVRSKYLERELARARKREREHTSGSSSS